MLSTTKIFVRVSIFVALLVTLIAITTQPVSAAENKNAKQIKLKIDGPYGIVLMEVHGDNQWGNSAYWPEKSSLYPYSEKPYKCEYGAIAPQCPGELITKDYWWQSKVSPVRIDFQVYIKIPLDKKLITKTCYMNIDEKSWFDTVTATYHVSEDRLEGCINSN